MTNSGSNTVTVLDLVHLRQDRVISVGKEPTGVTASPNRNEIYIVNSGNDSVTVINAETNTVAATIPVRRAPYFIDVSADGRWGYVANSGSNDVSVIDLLARKQVAVIGVGESPGLARVSPDGKTLVVTNAKSGSVSLVDTGTRRVRSAFPNCPGATDAVILRDSSKALIACSGGHQVMVLGLARSGGLESETKDRLLSLLDVGKTPVHLALKPDGGEVFASNFDSDSVSEIVTSTNEVGGAYPIGTHPARGIVSRDNSLLWVSDFGGAVVSVYSIDDGKLLPPPVHVGEGPDALAFSSEGHLLLVVDSTSGDVAVVRTASRSLFTMLPTGLQPSGIAVKAFKTH